MRKIRQRKQTPAPKTVVSISLDTTLEGYGIADRSGCVALAGWSLVASQRTAGVWRPVHFESGTTADQFWNSLEFLARFDTHLYCLCPRASTALTLLRWWDRVRSGRYTVWRSTEVTDQEGEVIDPGKRRSTHPLVIAGVPDIIGYDFGATEYRWVGPHQFGSPPDTLAGGPAAVADRLDRWFTGLLSAWIDSGCGPWRDSVGAAAWGTYQMRCSREPIVIHSNPAAQKVEGLACHGGRASIWTVRPVGGKSEWHDYDTCPDYPRSYPSLPGPVYRLDVKGMYPSLMRDREFPVRLRGVYTGWTVDRLARSFGGTLKIARVTLRTRAAEYPCRRGSRVSYPVGEFITTLAEPELRRAVEDGEVVAVHAVCSYDRGRPFKDWAEWVIGLRERAKAYHVPGWEAYVKHISVALSGKLAMRPGGWVNRPQASPRLEWGEWHLRDVQTAEERHFRSLGGHVQEWVRTGPRPGCLAACYAFLTAYGRSEMRVAREIAGVQQVIAQHTDGLIVTKAGREALRRSGLILPNTYGMLRDEQEIRCLWMRGPNHFWADGKWTVAGVAGGYTVTREGIIRESVTIDPARCARDPTAGIVYERIRTIDPATINNGERISRTGWVIPPAVGKHSDTANRTLFGQESD